MEIYDLPHEVVNLSDALRRLCVRLVEQLELSFGAIDFLLTPDGEYVFLEINPNGQWLWLEDMTGLPLSKTLAELLLSR